MVTKESIMEKIQSTLACEFVDVIDMSDGTGKFSVTVVSESFNGKSLVQRHRLIYEIFSEELKGPIHALELKTLTPSQFNPNN